MKKIKFVVLLIMLVGGVAWGSLLVGNQFGQAWELSDGGDLATLQGPTGTFGAVTAVARLNNGNMVIGNAAGSLYVVNPSDISTALYTASLGSTAISHLAVQSDNSIVAGNAVNGYLYRRSSTLGAVASGVGFINMGTSFANFTAMTLQSNDKIVVGAANGNLQIRNSAGTADYSTFGTYVGLSAISVRGDDGLWVTSSTSGYMWNLTSTLGSAGTTLTGFSNADLIGMQRDGDFAVLDSTNGYMWFRNADGTGKTGGFMTGFGGASGIDFDDQDQAYIVSTSGTIWHRDANMGGVTSRTGFGELRDVAVIPEPVTLGLLGTGVAGLFILRRFYR